MAKTKAPRPKRTPRSAKKTTTATKTSSTKKPSPKKQRAADFDGDALYERSIAKSLEAERKRLAPIFDAIKCCADAIPSDCGADIKRDAEQLRNTGGLLDALLETQGRVRVRARLSGITLGIPVELAFQAGVYYESLRKRIPQSSAGLRKTSTLTKHLAQCEAARHVMDLMGNGMRVCAACKHVADERKATGKRGISERWVYTAYQNRHNTP